MSRVSKRGSRDFILFCLEHGFRSCYPSTTIKKSLDSRGVLMRALSHGISGTDLINLGIHVRRCVKRLRFGPLPLLDTSYSQGWKPERRTISAMSRGFQNAVCARVRQIFHRTLRPGLSPSNGSIAVAECV